MWLASPAFLWNNTCACMYTSNAKVDQKGAYSGVGESVCILSPVLCCMGAEGILIVHVLQDGTLVNTSSGSSFALVCMGGMGACRNTGAAETHASHAPLCVECQAVPGSSSLPSGSAKDWECQGLRVPTTVRMAWPTVTTALRQRQETEVVTHKARPVTLGIKALVPCSASLLQVQTGGDYN